LGELTQTAIKNAFIDAMKDPAVINIFTGRENTDYTSNDHGRNNQDQSMDMAEMSIAKRNKEAQKSLNALQALMRGGAATPELLAETYNKTMKLLGNDFKTMAKNYDAIQENFGGITIESEGVFTATESAVERHRR